MGGRGELLGEGVIHAIEARRAGRWVEKAGSVVPGAFYLEQEPASR